MSQIALPRNPLLRRAGIAVLAAALGVAALPATDAAAAGDSHASGVAGLHAVKGQPAVITYRSTPATSRRPGARDSVTASDGTTASLVPAPPDGPARSTWIVNYDSGFTTATNGAAAQAAFQAAVDVWSHIITSSVPIVVNASYANLGGNVLGQAYSAEALGGPGLGDGTHGYPIALANALLGYDYDPSNPDIVAQFNSSPVEPFYYGTDGAPTSGTVDFESVVMHELGHGLGFAGSMTMSGSNVTYASTPMKWDTYLQNGSGTSMLSYASGSSQLTTAMESPLYWNGSNGITANGGTNPTMYAPATWQQGSSGGAHLDEATYPEGNAFSLMTPSITSQEAVHSPGAVAVAMLHDIGWTASLPTGSAPSAPTGVTATRGDGRATVAWNASTDYGNAVTQYVATASPGGATCSTTGALTCAVTGLTNGTSYTFTVTATNSIGTSTASSASAAVVPAGKPGTPTAPSATANNAAAAVSWTAPSNNGDAITGYDVESSADNGSTWSSPLSSALTSNATQATFSGLTNGTSYVFRVAAINTVGEGSMSPQSAAVVPAAGAPAAPTGVTASRGDTQASVSWTAPSDTGGGPITGYSLEWSSDNGATWSSPLASATTSTLTSATVTGLTDGTAYVFRVAAINAIGTGAFSAQSAATTPAGVPGAPTNVGGTPGNTQVTVTWTAPSNNGDPITGYSVQSSTDGANWSSPLASALTSTATAAVVSSLTNGQAYRFRVAAINGIGTGSATATSSTITPATVPGAPTNVTASPGDTKALVSWTAPASNGGASVTSYTIRISIDNGGSWSTLGSIGGTAVNITNLTNGTTYVFDVAATNSAGTSAYSATSNAVTPASVPGAPSNVTGAAGNGQVSVTWTAPSSNGGSAVTGYDVEWSSDSGNSWSSPLSSAQSSTSTAALVTGLTNGTSYVFKVAARNVIGAGSFSTTSAAVMPAGAPTSPTSVSAVAGNGQATVSWSGPSSNGGATISSYDVRYSSNSGSTWTSAGVAYTGSPATVTGLTNGTSYLFEVAAINSIGASSYSSPSSAVTPSGPPAAPTGVTATAGNGQATVDWTPGTNGGSAITAYAIRYSSDNGSTWTVAGSAYTTHPQTVTGLTNGTSYIFEVNESNANGSSAYSTASTAVTPATVPAAPTSVSAVAGDQKATVSWTAPGNNGGASITGYDVRYSSNNGTTWTSAGVVYSGSPATVTGLTNGTPYVFDVAAINSVGTGAYSTASAAVTPAGVPAAPTSVTGTRGNGQVSVSWLAGSSNGANITGYAVRYSTDSGANWTAAGTFGSSPATVTGLTNGTPYVFEVAAINSAGTGAYSTASSAVTPATTPGVPTGLLASAGDSQASLSWSAPSSDGGTAITAYNLQWSSNNGTTWSGKAVTSTSTLLTGLVNGTPYVFRVAAVNGVGSGSYSANSAPFTPATTPSTPTSVTATAGDQRATVSWTTASNGGAAITSYDVRYSTNNGTTWTSAGVAYPGSPATVTGLTNGTSYVFDVAAINSIGTSAYSSATSAVVPAGVTGAPTGVTATAGNAQATVSWTAPSTNGSAITSYEVRYSTNSGATWTSAGASFASSPATITGLSNGTSYVFDVAAIDANGTGAYSAASLAVTPSTTPGVPAFASITRGDGQVSLTWSAPSNGGSAITGYDVEWTSDGGTTWSSPLASAANSPATSATVTGLTDGTTYKFRIAAVNANGAGTFSGMSNGVTPAGVPGTPTAVAATAGDASATVSWTAPASNGAVITSYEVRYSSDNGTSWTSFGSVGATQANVTGLTNGTSYVFDVAAHNLIGQGSFSAPSSAVIPATVPGAPTGVVGAAGPGQVSLSWTAPSDGGNAITGYDVEWSSDNGTTWSSPLSSATTNTATAAIVTGLTNGTSYVFQVAAINGLGTGNWSAQSAPATPATTPSAPTAVTASAGNQQATVSWQPGNDGGSSITSYDVRYSSDSGATWTSAGVAYSGSPATVTGLVNGTSYVFDVAEINGVGTSAYSAASSPAVPSGVPGTPSGVSASAGDAQATVTWTAPSANGSTITGYEVRYSTNGGTTWTSAGANFSSSPATVTGLANGTSYVFDVAAIDANGTGAYSTASSPVTPSTTPGVPTSVSLTRGDGQVSLTWSAPADGGATITGYDVEWSGDAGATWSTPLSSATTSAATAATVTGLTNGTGYIFRIAAINANGTGTFTDASGTMTPAGAPFAPTGVSATGGNGSAMVSWTPPDGNGSAVTSYVVEYSTDGGTTWTPASGSFANSPATVSGLTNGTPYVFAVAAVNDAGTGAFSAASAAVTPATTPGAVTNVTAVRDGDGSLAVTWTAPADGGSAITGYDVEWSTDGTNWSAPLDSATTSTDTGAAVTGLTNGTPYEFRVAAVNGVGTGPFSTASAFATPATVPGVPGGVSAVAGDSQATVSWQPPANGGAAISSYDVRYSSDGGTTWTSTGAVLSASPATVTGLVNGTSYLFDVAAINDVGASEYSAATSAVKPWRDASSLTQGASLTVNYGVTVVEATVLHDKTTGATMAGYGVDLLSRTSTALPWKLVRTVSTSWTGGVKLAVRPPVRTMYMWRFNGVPNHAATTSTVQTVSVAQTVAASATATSIVHGGVVKFYGTVAPNEANQYVYLQILVSRTWKTTAVKAKLVYQRLPNGHSAVGFVLALKTGTTGTYSYRVYRPATTVNSAGLSKVMSLRVT